MKNLKKVLALVLVVASVLSFATVASAASFTDKDSITNTEAVNMLADLGVINGFTDGSYRPTETVTRAQMAKMIYAVCTGDDDASGFVGTATALKDLNQAPWAEGYIKYCYSLGIIGGFPDNTFRPNEPVTVAQAAKMLLVALGYDSNEYVGASWSVNAMRDAKAAKITKNVSVSSAMAASRDVSAQLIYNTMFADQVIPEYQYDMGVKYVTGYKKAGTTLAEDSFDMVKVTGRITAVGEDDTVTISGTKTVDGEEKVETKVVKLPGDYDMLGKTGTVYYKNDNGKESLYSTSIAVDDDQVLFTSYNNTSVYDAGVKSGKKVALEDEITVITNGTEAEAAVNVKETFTSTDKNGVEGKVVTNGKGVVHEYIDIDSNGKADILKVTQLTPVKISTYNTINKKLSVSKVGQGGSVTKTSWDFDDVLDVESYAKDDIAMAIEFAGKLNLTPTTVVNGTVSGLVASSSSVRIDGTVYAFHASTSEANGYGGDNTSRGAEGKFYLDANNYIVYADTEATTSVDKLAYVKKVAPVDTFNEVQKATLVFTDGTQATVEISKVSQTEDGSVSTVTDANKVADGDVVSYTVSDGKYQVKKVELYDISEDATIKKGTPQAYLVDDKSAITTANTLYVDVENKAVYTGYANVPSQSATNLAGALVKLNSDESKVELVFMLKADTSSSNTKFFVFNVNGYETSKKGDDEIRTYDVIVDGEVTTLDVLESVGSGIDKVGYYEGKLNSKGNISELDAAKFSEGTAAGTNNENLGGDKSTVLVVGDKTYVVDESTVYYQIKDKKANLADISLVDDVDVSKVYVQVVGTKTDAEKITAAVVYFIY